LFDTEPSLSAVPTDGDIIYSGSIKEFRYLTNGISGSKFIGFYNSGSNSRLETFSYVEVELPEGVLTGSPDPDKPLKSPSDPPYVVLNTDPGYIKFTDSNNSQSLYLSCSGDINSSGIINANTVVISSCLEANNISSSGNIVSDRVVINSNLAFGSDDRGVYFGKTKLTENQWIIDDDSFGET